MVMCGGALTSFHRVLPTVTLGYAINEFLDGLQLSFDFLTHASVLLTFALYMCENEKNEILSTMLALEVSYPFKAVDICGSSLTSFFWILRHNKFSSIFYNLARATFLTPTLSLINTAAFVITFFLARILFGPWSWWQIVKLLYTEGMSEKALACAPRGHRHFVSISGIFFHVLNGYWFIKILQKVQRMMKGKDNRKAKKEA